MRFRSLATTLAGVLLSVPLPAQKQPAAPAAAPAAAPPVIRFEDLAARAGLTATNVYGDDHHKQFIIETTGNGAAIFDYDNDGWPDIFLVNGATLPSGLDPGAPPPPGTPPPSNLLYHNNHDGTFTDVTAKAGLTHSGWGQGACVGDYDNDGHLDLMVTYWGQNVLYHNNGDGTFTDVTRKAGLESAQKLWTTGCSFVDYDRDGKADLFLARYVDFDYNTVPKPGQGQWCQWKGINVMCGPRGLKGGVNGLFHNNGDGTFSDVSAASGVVRPAGYYCFSPLTGDFDHDGWPDIYVACDSTPSILYHNNHNGTFTDIGTTAGVAFNEDGGEQAGMGVAAGDVLRNDNLDIVKTNFADDTSSLYINRGDGNFDDMTYAAGLGSVTRWLGWGAAFLDMDNDGWPDILLANGHVYPEVDGKGLGTSYRQPKVAYYNQHNGTFLNISDRAGPGLTTPHSSRGLAVGDLFNDGRQEAVVVNMNQPPSLLRNAGPVGHFLSLQLEGVKSNRAALGAEVTVQAGGHRALDEVRSGGSFISQNDLRLHFGLGDLKQAERVTVRWPSGLTSVYRDVAADHFYIVKEGAAALTPDSRIQK